MCGEERQDALNTKEESVKTWIHADVPQKVDHTISQKSALGSAIYGYLELSTLLFHAGEIPAVISVTHDVRCDIKTTCTSPILPVPQAMLTSAKCLHPTFSWENKTKKKEIREPLYGQVLPLLPKDQGFSSL